MQGGTGGGEFEARIECGIQHGAGNRLDPTRIIIADISKTEVCPLARTHADAIPLFIWNRNHVRISKIHIENDNAALMRRYLSADGMPIGSVIEC